MKRSAKILYLVLGLAVFLSSAVSANAGEKVKIGISIPTADHGWTGGVVYWAEQAIKDFSAKYPDAQFMLVTADAPAKQISDIEDLVVQGIKGLVILPHEPAPLAPTLNEIKRSGVFTVVVDRTTPEVENDIYVAGDNLGFGVKGGEFLVKEMGGRDVQILVMTNIPSDVDTLRVEGFNSVVSKHPNIKILDSQPAFFSTQKGLEVMENYLQKYPKVDALWTGDDDVLKGAMQAYKESGRNDIQLMLGGGGSKDIIKMVIDGDPLVRATTTYPPKMIYHAAEMAAEHLVNGKKYDETMIIPSVLVTKENAQENYYPDSVF